MQYNFSKIFDLHPTAKSFLDLGCGKGITSLYAVARGLQVDAIDIDSERPAALLHIPHVTFQSVDLINWKPKKRWDIIVAHHILQFLDKEYALNFFIPELIESLNPGGILEIYTFTPEETLDVPTKYSLDEIVRSVADLTVLDKKVYQYDGMQRALGKHTFHEVWVLSQKKDRTFQR